MTKYINYLGLALMLLIASCSTDIEVVNPEHDTTLVNISVMAESNDDTRLMLDGNRTEWEVGDRITLALTGSTTKYYTFEIASDDDIFDNGKRARFSGSVAMGSYTLCTAIYPAITDNGSIISRHDGAVYMAARYDNSFMINSVSASIPMSFSHLMHKVDYNLTLASGYTDTDITKGIAIEMVARSSGEEVSLAQCFDYDIYMGECTEKANSTSHVADFTQHNFATESIASALIFPTTIPNAELEFNVYVEGRKAHTIVKDLDKEFTMSAGKSSKISLELSADNKVKEEAIEDNGDGGIASDFEPDYYITTFKNGVSGVSLSYGIGFRAYFNNTYFDVHIPAKYAQSDSINEGEYTWTGTSWFGYNSYQDFTTRNAGSLDLSSPASLASGSKMVVAKSGSNYIIDITLIDNKGKTVKAQYIGELNVDNGGQVGGNGGSTSSTQPDITLSTLSLNTSADYHTLEGSSSSGDAITLRINAIDGIASGAYEHIALGYCHHKGYFNASNIVVGGAAKSAKSGILYISTSGSATTLHADITFSDGITRHFKFEGSIDRPVVVSNITLSASKTSLKANGSDSVTFTVKTDNGTTVTDSCEIYVNDINLSGTTFSTYTAGSYSVYAKYNGVTSNTITLTATAVASDATTVFAEGVSQSSGWYDVNKKSTTTNPGADAMMCWAASSSNIVQWFQDRYTAAGNTLPSGCPNGTSSKYEYELQIMDVYRDNWGNLARGSWTDAGVIWYFEGSDIYSTMGTDNRAYPISGTGGYFKSVWSSIYPSKIHQHSGGSYAVAINNYSWRGNSNPLKAFSDYIVEAFKYGMTSMAVAMNSNFSGAHAVTIWGYEIDKNTGCVTKLFITDSDDGSTPTLQTYTVTSDNSNAKIKLSGYTSYYPFELYPISGYGSN
ncbi:MAG: hypothetical protein J6Q36_06180 [Alistipes sp.]|nr:hypothetical protein [Alistipes sp.]